MERRSARGATGRSSADGRGKGGAATPAAGRGTPKSGGTSGKRQRKKTPTPPPPSLPPIPEGMQGVLQKNDWLVAVKSGDCGSHYYIARHGSWDEFWGYSDCAERVGREILAEVHRLVAFEKAALARHAALWGDDATTNNASTTVWSQARVSAGDKPKKRKAKR